MKNKLVMIIAAIILSVVVAAPVLNAAKPAPSPAMPFVGMSMLYYGNANWDEFVQRTIVVVKYNPENNSVLIQDTTDESGFFDYYTVNVATRTVTSATMWPYTDCVGTDTCAVELWIPTSVKVGSVVNIGNGPVEVVGSRVLSVEGKPVDCWQLYVATNHPITGNPMEDTWYYEKRTGLWIGASWYELDVNRVLVINHWTGYLASTNVPL
jgi:hypothetical protein